MAKIMKTKVFDFSFCQCALPCTTNLLHCISLISEAASPVLTLNTSQSKNGIPIKGQSSTFFVFGRTMIQPCDTPIKINASPFHLQSFVSSASSRQSKLHHWTQVFW